MSGFYQSINNSAHTRSIQNNATAVLCNQFLTAPRTPPSSNTSRLTPQKPTPSQTHFRQISKNDVTTFPEAMNNPSISPLPLSTLYTPHSSPSSAHRAGAPLRPLFPQCRHRAANSTTPAFARPSKASLRKSRRENAPNSRGNAAAAAARRRFPVVSALSPSPRRSTATTGKWRRRRGRNVEVLT